MIKTRLIQPLVGSISFALHTVNTLTICIPLFVLAFLKLLLPFESARNFFNALLNWLATAWISINNIIIRTTKNTKVECHGGESLSEKDWYLVLANHQSWVDILILQMVLNKKIPFLKFFLKKELIFVPVLGLAWWALDFPFMKRYSKSYLKKNPHKKGKDLETTKKACEKFQHIPISVMNFVEGTRFTQEKADRQNSPYKKLLKPKSGGVGTVLSILGEQMRTVVDVTIVYPGGIPTFWDLMCGRIDNIKVFIKTHDIAPELIGDMNNSETRLNVQAWLNEIWQEKDQLVLTHQKS
ncbi:acyltransferase [Pleionea sp. CnH1-48]|uniref:acyltransferase n=1 Tax=Pleionea sp. CnH1-48 TaxID=2954494 RepID=UPI002097453B|nr:acyltransferase [Pleionea sp. CnH1-48]MCO7227072.1 acyltransferase [Pleionea sp. CnH1-48]